jgi:TolB-like protein/DNA-binding winged helix-turn-helix (wHTH) protein/tetratricopeptide (TPR) repeat protein
MADRDVGLPAPRINLAEEPDFDLGRMRIRPAERAVVIDGERRELQPRVMQVLVALAQARPAVVSRDRLIELCWDGRVVGDDALNRCVLALRHLAQEVRPQPFTIETVPRVGHRLIENEVSAAPTQQQPPRSRQWRSIAVAAAFLLVLAAGLFFWEQRGEAPEPVSIAVLPFRNVGTGEPYFAEGIGEEILGQLAREPHFRVAGSSSSSQFGSNPDIRQVARRLNVHYVLEGSVRRQGNQVRVNAGLVRAKDETRLWSDSYDGKLDDIFAIQQRIGAAIAGALQRKLVRAPALSGPLVTKGEAYNLYLTARALIRTRNRRVGRTAVELLRDAIRIDPGYAPAWASLAEATMMQGALADDREQFIPALRNARRYARHAVSLAPELDEAHRALGRTFDYGDPEGVVHLRRAAALDPNNAESLIELGSALAASGEFERELATYRRANELDPLWYRTTGATGITLAEMGDRAEAEAFGQRRMTGNDANRNILLGRIAWTVADYSEAARRWALVVQSNSPRWAPPAQRTLYDATHAVGINTGALVDVPEPPSDRSNWRAWMDAPPAPAVWRQRNRDPIAAAVYRKHNVIAAKLMLNAGRWRELVAIYDSPVGLFGLRPRKGIRVDQLHEVPVVAVALREAGRGAEAGRLLREADAAVRAVYRRGRVPFWFDADAAALFAVQGRNDEALATLERAFRRGWRQNGSSDLRHIADEPAFRTLHNEPRFKAIAARVEAHYAKERREIEQLLRG